jgi:hypothetical protein
VHHVVAQLVVTTQDEDFLALDQVAAVFARRGAGLEIAEAGAGLQRCRCHGAEEAACAQRGELARLLFA